VSGTSSVSKFAVEKKYFVQFRLYRNPTTSHVMLQSVDHDRGKKWLNTSGNHRSAPWDETRFEPVPMNEQIVGQFGGLFSVRSLTDFCVTVFRVQGHQLIRCNFLTHPAQSPPDHFQAAPDGEYDPVTPFEQSEIKQRDFDFTKSVRISHRFRLKLFVESADYTAAIYELHRVLEPYMHGWLFNFFPIYLKTDGKDSSSVNAGSEVALTAPTVSTCEMLSRLWGSPSKKIMVLVSGPPGSGKEAISNAIHYGRRRKDQPQTLNFAAISQQEADARLYGSLTDRGDEVKGLVGRAEGGTIFIDEVHQAKLEVRASLLRMLESREFMIPDSNKKGEWRDVQWVFATSRPLRELRSIKEYGPADFWTRMTHVLEVPHPIAGGIQLDNGHRNSLETNAGRIFFFHYAQGIVNAVTPDETAKANPDALWVSLFPTFESADDGFVIARKIVRLLIFSDVQGDHTAPILSRFAQTLLAFFTSYLAAVLEHMSPAEHRRAPALETEWIRRFQNVSIRCLVNIGQRVAGIALGYYDRISKGEFTELVAAMTEHLNTGGALAIEQSGSPRVVIERPAAFANNHEADSVAAFVQEIAEAVYDLLALTSAETPISATEH
jgi:hypothetical protein